MRIVAQRAASVIGFKDPAANGAIVRGTRETAINLETTLVSVVEVVNSIGLTSRKSSDSCRGLAMADI